MGNTRQLLGALGEDIAATYLENLGWRILDRNWRCTLGELDIVAADGNAIVAVEVKTRRTLQFGSPMLAVTAEKYSRLRTLAVQWLKDSERSAIALRIDVISVLLTTDDPEITHIRGEAGW